MRRKQRKQRQARNWFVVAEHYVWDVKRLLLELASFALLYLIVWEVFQAKLTHMRANRTPVEEHSATNDVKHTVPP